MDTTSAITTFSLSRALIHTVFNHQSCSSSSPERERSLVLAASASYSAAAAGKTSPIFLHGDHRVMQSKLNRVIRAISLVGANGVKSISMRLHFVQS